MPDHPDAPSRPDRSKIALVGLGLAVAAALAALAAGPGHRFGLWSFGTGFQVLRWASYGALLGAAVSLGAAVLTVAARGRRGLGLALLGIVVGLATAYVPWSWKRTAERVPPIHDVTTDLEDPPAFVAVLEARAGAPNPAEHGGPEIAEQQRQAYPDVRPLVLDAGPDRAFDRALEAARGMGWEIVAARADEGRIEATATTPWFGFEDDIVVRVRPVGAGSRIDVRSVSRVGRSDLGTNAERIRNYLGEIRDG